MVRVPRHATTSTLTFKNSDNLINKILFKYSGEVRDYGNGNNGFKDVMLDDYVVVDYNMNCKIFNNYNFYLNLNNIFNNNYEKAFMYSSMGRSLNLGINKAF